MKTNVQPAAGTAASRSSASELERIALDLLGRLPSIAPRRVANLCGTRDVTERLLKSRFPGAEVVSIQFAKLASQHAIKGGIQFLLARELGATEPFDLVFCNSTLEIRPSLWQLAPELLPLTEPGGWLAFQLPNNLHEPNRQIQRMLAVDGPWAKKLLPIAKTRPFNETFEGLNVMLGSHCSSIEFWETTYVYRLDGVAAIIDSMKEASLAPFLAPLGADMRQQFLKRFARELAKAYPRQPDGKILWRFPRIFFVARR